MTAEHEPDLAATAQAADAESSAAGAAGAAPDESVPEGAVAVDEQPAADAPGEPEAVDPLAGKSDEEIRELAAQAGDYLALAQRTRADFDNYRKRAQRDLAAARVRGGVELARELLAALDNAERALEHESAVLAEAPDEDPTARRILDALKATHEEFVAGLGRGGIERFAPLGEPFDPTRHEALAKRPAEDGEAAGTCGPVFQPGYAAGEEIIRPARVVVTE